MSEKRTGWAFPLALALIVLLLIGGTVYGYAWDVSDPTGRIGQARKTAEEPISVADPTPTPDLDEVGEVSKELYCPLCTGVRLDNCDLPLCDQMREVIRQKLADGETKEEIVAYFVEQYGEMVTGTPPKRGGMILAWVIPFLVLFGAGGWVYYATHHRAGQRQLQEEATSASRPLPVEYVERVERDLERLE